MKNLNEVLNEHPEYKPIIRWVYKDIGKDSISDVNNHGIAGGFGSFIYYSDTVKFWRKFKNDIIAMMKEDCEAINNDKNILFFCCSFNCLKNYDADEIASALYGSYNEENMQIYNGFAWYAAETICRWFED